MHAFLIVGQSAPEREKEIEKLLALRGVVRSPLHCFVLSPRQLRERETYGIEDVRSVTRWTSQLHEQPCAVLIEESERLTEPAQHALLKTLEEGSPHLTMVLSAAGDHSLLPTIRSRCRIIRVIGGEGELSREESQKIVAWLTKVSEQEPAKRILMLYQALSKIAGKTISPHLGAIARADAEHFVKRIISGLHVIARSPFILSDPPVFDLFESEDSAEFIEPEGSSEPERPERPKAQTRRAGGESKDGNLTWIADILKTATIAHRRLQQNLNVALALQQFVLDIP